MTGRRVVAFASGLVFAVAVLITAPSPAAAECPGWWGPWPSFRKIAPTAKRVIIGKVTRDADAQNLQPGLVGGVPGHAVVDTRSIPNPTGSWRAEWTGEFELEVQEVLRGADRPGESIVIRYLEPGVRLSGRCGQGAYLLARPGDVIGLAFGARDTAGHTNVNVAAWVTGGVGGECGCSLTETDRMTIAEIRRVVGLVPADSVPTARGPVWQR